MKIDPHSPQIVRLCEEKTADATPKMKDQQGSTGQQQMWPAMSADAALKMLEALKRALQHGGLGGMLSGGLGKLPVSGPLPPIIAEIAPQWPPKHCGTGQHPPIIAEIAPQWPPKPPVTGQHPPIIAEI